MAQVQTIAPQSHFDWAADAYNALNLNDHNSPPAMFKQAPTSQHAAFGIPPSLLNQSSIERYGQITPPEDLSPASPPHDAREGSIPVEQLRNEASWTPDHQQQSGLQEPAAKRRRTSRTSAAIQSQANNGNGTSLQQDADPQPPKRKRGRPKSQPQMIEAYTADGFPFQVSSARQSHLEKNRVAAHKCRQRKKEYINSLEGRAREFSSKNKALKENVAMLRDEVLGLKNEVLRHAGCGFWAVDEYLARCAGDLLGMQAPPSQQNYSSPIENSDTKNPFMNQRYDSADADNRQPADARSPDDDDEFGGLELLRGFDEEDMDDLE